jgi:hypothetical protein
MLQIEHNIKQAFQFSALVIFIFLFTACTDTEQSDAEATTGKGGSMARFATTPEYVYTVDNQSLFVYQRQPNGSLLKINERRLNTLVETIFCAADKLFLGSESAIFIYDIKNGSNPELLTSYSHIISCDPVVVKDTLAFATFRLSDCRLQGIDVLEVINVKNLLNPVSLGMYAVPTPYGLAVDGDNLFVCLGENGLRVFDVSNPANLKIKSNHVGFHAFDVIVDDEILIITGNAGIRQYEYTANQLQLISNLSLGI